jgi:hypothetical protein
LEYKFAMRQGSNGLPGSRKDLRGKQIIARELSIGSKTRI